MQVSVLLDAKGSLRGDGALVGGDLCNEYTICIKDIKLTEAAQDPKQGHQAHVCLDSDSSKFSFGICT
jgi:hypothetical protein